MGGDREEGKRQKAKVDNRTGRRVVATPARFAFSPLPFAFCSLPFAFLTVAARAPWRAQAASL
jgi:hypothetical protein